MIVLDNEYKITRDPYCWILSRTYTPEGVHPKTEIPFKEKTVQTYHGTLQQALSSYVDEAIADSQPGSVQEILYNLKRIETTIKNIKA